MTPSEERELLRRIASTERLIALVCVITAVSAIVAGVILAYSKFQSDWPIAVGGGYLILVGMAALFLIRGARRR